MTLPSTGAGLLVSGATVDTSRLHATLVPPSKPTPGVTYSGGGTILVHRTGYREVTFRDAEPGSVTWTCHKG